MASPYQMFKTDEKAELEVGVILDYDDFRIRIARAGGSNKKFSRMLNTRLKPHRVQLENETLSDAVANKILIETYADAVVLGFEVKQVKDNGKGKVTEYVSGVPDRDGKLQPYSREQVIRIFTDLPDLFRDVQSQANKVSLFRSGEQEEVSKNSPAV